jgi:hypothetical protein
MKKPNFTGQLRDLTIRADNGNSSDIDYIMGKLTISARLSMTRFVDYSLSRVENVEGMKRIRFYLFNGTIIQRNYASLFFNRLGEWKVVKEAFDKGLIDEIQAFAR